MNTVRLESKEMAMTTIIRNSNTDAFKLAGVCLIHFFFLMEIQENE